jgi:chromosome segregation ATPase
MKNSRAAIARSLHKWNKKRFSPLPITLQDDMPERTPMNTQTKLENLKADLQDVQQKLTDIASLRSKDEETLKRLEASLKDVSPDELIQRELSLGALERTEKRFLDVKAKLEGEIQACEQELARAKHIEMLVDVSEKSDALFNEEEAISKEINDYLVTKIEKLQEIRAKQQALKGQAWPLLNYLGFQQESQAAELESFLTELGIEDGAWRERSPHYTYWWQCEMQSAELPYRYLIRMALSKDVRPNDPTPFTATKLEDL